MTNSLPQKGCDFMSLAVILQRNYEVCLKENLVGNWEVKEGEAVLLPIYHSNTRSVKNNIFLLQLDKNGEAISGSFLPQDDIIIYPVTEDSVSRSSGSSSRPLVDEFQYLNPVQKNKEDLYLEALKEWLDYTKEGVVKQFLQIVYDYTSKGKLEKDLLDFIAQGNPYKYDKDKQFLEVEIEEKGKITSKKYDLRKVIVEFEIINMIGDKNWRPSTSSELHNAFIDFQEHKNLLQEQDICAITGKLMYCTNKHRGMMGNAKIIGVSNNKEAYFGRFKEGSDIVKIGYKTSNEIHNMLKYLLESKNTSTRLSYKKGKSGGDPAVLLTWFSDDVLNERKTDILQPESSLTNFFQPLNDLGYIAGGETTKNIQTRFKGFDVKTNPNAKVYLMILDKASNGRISIKYFRESPQSQFYENMEKWYDDFQWLFYDKEAKGMKHRSPSLPQTIETVFGYEQDSGFVSISDSKNKFKENWLTNLIPCVIEGKNIPLGLVQRSIENIRNRQRYSKSWEGVLAVSCAVISKYYMDYNGERKNEMLDTSNQNRSYLYGRVLALLEYLEQQSLRDQMGSEQKSIRQTNAERHWNNYLRTPAKTLNFLIQRGRPYWDRVKKNKPKFYVIAQKELDECINLLGEIEAGKNKNRPLDEEFIFGYYAQRRALYQSKEDKQQNEQITEDK